MEIEAIRPCAMSDIQFISSYFLVPKKEGGFRFVLNLKKLNSFISTDHFKLEDYRTAMRLMSEGDYMGKALLILPNPIQPLLILPKFAQDQKLCVVETLEEYIEVTRTLRQQNKQRLLITRKPFGPTSPETRSRWLRTTLAKCNIGENFSGHSTRHAATSAALKKGVDLSMIRKTACWSKNSQTFAKHYNSRPIESLYLSL